MDARLADNFDWEGMPLGELRILAEQVMIKVPSAVGREELVAAVTAQLDRLDALDRQVLLDIVVWGRRPVAKSADKLQLLREINQIKATNYEALGYDALKALAQLRGVPLPEQATQRDLVALLVRGDGVIGWFSRQRRAVMAKVIGKLLDADREDDHYQFLPEARPEGSLRRQIERQGVMGGLTTKLKDVADGYINSKLDEIEARIDRKLDEIDRRLSEWRDQEIANRLRIVKVTLIGSIVVAVLSLVYRYVVAKF